MTGEREPLDLSCEEQRKYLSADTSANPQCGSEGRYYAPRVIRPVLGDSQPREHESWYLRAGVGTPRVSNGVVHEGNIGGSLSYAVPDAPLAEIGHVFFGATQDDPGEPVEAAEPDPAVSLASAHEAERPRRVRVDGISPRGLPRAGRVNPVRPEQIYDGPEAEDQ